METRSFCPDFTALQVPWDTWSKPFWDATAERKLLLPRCGECETFRWPASPFCFKCRSQKVDWVPPGQAHIYSFTILPVRGPSDAPPQSRIPALVEFDDAPGVRLVSALVDAPFAQVKIGAKVEIDWLAAANATVPVFRLSR